MAHLGLSTTIESADVLEKTIQRFRKKGIKLPTFAELEKPCLIDEATVKRLEDIDPHSPDPLNLYRIHWYNRPDSRGFADCPHSIELPTELTGVEARIVVMVGAHFPMIDAHKVLAAYGCLAPRLITGQFDPQKHKAIWPSTGNYCRGGVAVSRIMDCRGVAILPEEMSQERFNWLKSWCLAEEDIIATPGCESNVKEIYDQCNQLDVCPENIIFNQFSEFGNALIHYTCTGKALEHVFQKLCEKNGNLHLKAFISATGSAGTLAAGDYLKENYHSQIVAVEALQCPTLLYNGFGGHNIQGIGDKHVPLVHNAMNTDFVVAISDQNTDHLFTLFNMDAGKEYLQQRKRVPASTCEDLKYFGLSSICNILAAIKYAKYHKLGSDDVLMTVATDSAEMYQSEKQKVLGKEEFAPFNNICAAEIYSQYLAGLGTDHMQELTYRDKERIFNLGYYTWVEQQGISIEDFNKRKDPSFWKKLRNYVDEWDRLIDDFNQRLS
ncbi:MAG: pyridoxal-5'-phosphate-dependent protein subunit beta [Acidobacteria bacterium]|nr:MAG: pyridoxal-5'-phosphate-dependent protein subunit beta [Acidobacteriota bacterium]